jgi:hypothetical protein
MSKRNSVILFLRRLFACDLTPEEQAKYLGILEKVDPLWRLTGPPQRPATWKVLLMWLILGVGLVVLIRYWSSH